MNFNFYIFGTPNGRYNQYPDDYIASTLSHLQEHTEGARLVIQREMNLIHYVYTERVDESNVIGFCVIFNNIRILKPKRLIHFFRSLIEENLIESGNIIRYDNKGKLQYVISSFSESAKENDNIRETVNNELERNSTEYGFEPLQTVYNGTKTIDYIDFNACDSQIVQLTDKHNTVIVNHKVGIEHGYIPQVISTLRKQIKHAEDTISCLRSENISLNKRKKQYRYVVLLTLIVVGCCVGLYLFYSEVNDKEAHISNLENKISKLKITIEKKKTAINVLKDTITDLKHNIELITSYSISTGATIRNNDSHDNGWILWLRAKRKVCIESFYIKGQTSGNVDIGLYDTNDNLIAFYETNAVGGEFRKVNVGSEWIITSGNYYMKIRSGVNLQYHSSSDKEYSQFSGGALEVIGCCNYGDRTNFDSKNKHAFYQYFYSIRYRIVE